MLEIALVIHRLLKVGWRRAAQLEFMTSSGIELGDSSLALRKRNHDRHSGGIDRPLGLVK